MDRGHGGEERGRKERQGNIWAVGQTESTTDSNKVTPLHQLSKIPSLECVCVRACVRACVCVCDGGERGLGAYLYTDIESAHLEGIVGKVIGTVL